MARITAAAAALLLLLVVPARAHAHGHHQHRHLLQDTAVQAGDAIDVTGAVEPEGDGIPGPPAHDPVGVGKMGGYYR